MVIVKKKKLHKASKFVYHGRSEESVRNRAERQGGGSRVVPFKNGFDVFWAKNGDNPIRVLPPTWEPHDHYGFQVFEHTWIGPDNGSYLCLWKMKNKKCPICEAQKEAEKNEAEDEVRALAPKERYICWVINRSDEADSMPALYDMSWTNDRDLAAHTHDKKRGKILLIDHPDEGYDVTVKKQPAKPFPKYLFDIDREASPISDDDARQAEILEYITENPVPSVLLFRDYDYLENVLSGGMEEKDEDAEDEDDDTEEDSSTSRSRKTSGSKGSSKSRRASEEEESDEDEEEDAESEGEDEVDDDEDEKETRSSRSSKKTSRARTRVSDEDEGDEDEETDDEEEDDSEEESDETDEEEDEDEDDKKERKPVRRGSVTSYSRETSRSKMKKPDKSKRIRR